MKPIIDVHTHIFNAMDIPLEGYLRSRKDKGGIEGLLSPMLSRVIANCIRRKIDPKKKNIFLDTLCKVTMKVVYKVMGKPYRSWADTLGKKVIDVTHEMIDTYKKDKIDLYIPLVIDYEYWFKNSPDNPLKKQIKYIYKKIILAYKGAIHPFVPFDPARELAFRKKLKNPDGKMEKNGSLKLVKDAIENRGFIGVKLYNALGYKPFYNYSVDDKRRKIALHKKKYVFKGDEYDEVLSELYDYCVLNEIPITAHCIMDGIESYNQASWDFGQAKYWHDVLGKERYKNLHLNLAHFGWHEAEGFTGKKSWVRDICEMLANYDYLFTDVSCHRVVKYSEKFKSDYKEMCSKFPIVKERLLFGTDWHVLKRVKNFKKFKEKYIEVLKHEDLFSDEEIENFLGGNALQFLGLYKGGKNFERLKKFYKKENINPPEWFISIS